MDNFIQALRHDWHPMRVIYLVLAAMFLTQAWQAGDWTFGLLGGLFLYQSLFNAGCCGMSTARAAGRESHPGSLEDTEYTEIK